MFSGHFIVFLTFFADEDWNIIEDIDRLTGNKFLSPNFLRFSQPARFSTISMAFSEMLRYSVKTDSF